MVGSDLKERKSYCILLLLIVLFRLIITLARPYNIDMAGYAAWSRYLAEYGPARFYSDSGFHIVYAPFFLYFLWLTGEICRLFSAPAGFHVYLIKLVSVAFEFLGAWLMIKLSEKADRPERGRTMALLYLVNPGILMNSSVWGQFDSVPAAMLVGVLLLFVYKKQNLAALLFLVSVLTKPQSGLLLPVVLYLYFRDFRFDLCSFKKLTTGLLSGILLYLAVVMPFYTPTGRAGAIPKLLDPFYWLFDLYFRSMGDYPYATANAFNSWTLLGGQVQNDALPFMGLSYALWGCIFLAAALIFAFCCLAKGRGSLYSVTYFSYLVLFSAFFFMTRMHERYLLPAVIFLALLAAFDKRYILTYTLLSVCVFSNQFYLYIISFEERYWLERWDVTANFFAVLTLFTFGLSVYQGYKAFIAKSSIHSKEGDGA